MDLWDCALGFMDSQTLLTAEELGVFGALDGGGRTAADVAGAVGIPVDSAERLLIALCALEIVRRRDDGGYENGPEAAERLVPGKPGYIGAMFRHVREDLYPLWAHLREAIREGRPQWDRAFGAERARNEEIHSDPGSLRAFHDGMHAITHRAAVEFASRAPELGELGTVVDVGGSSGGFLIALARAFPKLRGITFDLHGVRPIAEEYFRRHGVADRLEFRAGDFFSDPIPAGADAYALGFILHDWDTGSGSRLLANIAEAAPGNAMLIVGEYLLDDAKSGPHWVARSNLNMLIAAWGRERNAKEYADWIARFGFALEKIYRTSAGKSFLIFRRR